jgi:hypothetical protein
MPMESPGRLFLCGRCRAHVLICRRCDRGQIYCGRGCSETARVGALRAAGRRYQQSRRGRFAHAERSRRYRQRLRQRHNVTHQGSPAGEPDALLPANVKSASNPATSPAAPLLITPWGCHFCGARYAEWVRIGLVRRQVPHPVLSDDLRGTHDDYPARTGIPHSSLLSRRAVARGYHRHAIGGASRHGAAGVGPGRLADPGAAAAAFADRSLPAVHSIDPGAVSHPHRQSAVPDGEGTRLPGRAGSLPPSGVLAPAPSTRGRVSPVAQLARRAGAGGLGTFRPSAAAPAGR